MSKLSVSLILCAASIGTASLGTARAEVFVIPADPTGHEATVKIPGGAVTALSANFAEWLASGVDSQFETMRLSGNVRISVAGNRQVIEINADDIVLELTPDSVASDPQRTTSTLPGVAKAQEFVGHVVFDLQTAAGPMEIEAGRVEHQLRPEAGA